MHIYIYIYISIYLYIYISIYLYIYIYLYLYLRECWRVVDSIPHHRHHLSLLLQRRDVIGLSTGRGCGQVIVDCTEKERRRKFYTGGG